ncbi:Zinc finger CCCH domain-containing protein 16 [Vitis vinifera]|uniref:Zinc finger CCCH domain-containing protein 16 n=1 Tax=Vitis vinifera TaxID=29760 RepID=A0A438IBQ0_VITVI|nr:Zinc finger CCCH domain-containing protein 16 [Vitis vinifera]
MSPDLVHKLAQTSSTQTFNSKGLILLDLVSRATLCQKGPLILDPSRTISSSSSSSRQSDNQVQPANHKCTDPESCKRQIVEDFEHERPIWKLTCYGHCKSAPCDIVGDISYEELRLAAYDDAGRGLSLQSIVRSDSLIFIFC